MFEDFDKEFAGCELIYNFAGDLEMELGNAARENAAYAQKRIDFCSECIRRFRKVASIMGDVKVIFF